MNKETNPTDENKELLQDVGFGLPEVEDGNEDAVLEMSLLRGFMLESSNSQWMILEITWSKYKEN